MVVGRNLLFGALVSPLFFFFVLIAVPASSHALDAHVIAHKESSRLRFGANIQGAVQGLVDSIESFTTGLPNMISDLQDGWMDNVFNLIAPMSDIVQEQANEVTGVYSQISDLSNSVGSLSSLQHNLSGLTDFNTDSFDFTNSLEGIIPQIGASGGQNVLGQITDRLGAVGTDLDLTEGRLDGITGELNALENEVPDLSQMLSTQTITEMMPNIEESMESAITSVGNEIQIKDTSIANLQDFENVELANLNSIASQGDLGSFNNQVDSYISTNRTEISQIDADLPNMNAQMSSLQFDLSSARENGNTQQVTQIRDQIDDLELDIGMAETRKIDLEAENSQLLDLKNLANTEGLSSVTTAMPTILEGLDSVESSLTVGRDSLQDMQSDMQLRLDGLGDEPLETVGNYVSEFADIIPSYTSSDLSGSGLGGSFNELQNQLGGTVDGFSDAIPLFGSNSSATGALDSLQLDIGSNISSLGGMNSQIDSSIGSFTSQIGSLEGELDSLLPSLQETFGDFSNMSNQYFGASESIGNISSVLDEGALTDISNSVSSGLDDMIANIQNLIPNLSGMLNQSFGSFLRSNQQSPLLRKTKLFKKVKLPLGTCKKPLKAYRAKKGLTRFKAKKRKFKLCKAQKSTPTPSGTNIGGTESQQINTLDFLSTLSADDRVGKATEELYGTNFVDEIERIEEEMEDLFEYMVRKYPILLFG